MWASENLVGRGGYAEVYKGTLGNGEEIAVKRMSKSSADERKEKEFLTEIGTIGHVCHPNVLSLLGCCVDNGLYLIFHFFSKGSVASLLHGISINGSRKVFLQFFFSLLILYYSLEIPAVDENLPLLDWKTRHKIAIGTARGLHYLHSSCQRRIIHRDIKASNVLLTADFEPQVSI